MKLCVLGATGRMGEAITRLALSNPQIQLVSATSRTKSGQTVSYTSDLHYTDNVEAAVALADVIIDFTLPAGVREHLPVIRRLKKAYVCGTTGLSLSDMQALEEASVHIPLLWSPNMSIGVTLLRNVIEQLAARLDENYDIEVLEFHHRHKKDAPSGTALLLGESAAKGRGRSLRSDEKICRTAGRQRGDIGFSALRGGHVVADCSVIFAGDEEVIEIKHHALTRDMFAKGALTAALWLYHQPAGFYDLSSVFA